MTIHKEGYRTITYTALFCLLVNVIVFYFFPMHDFLRIASLVVTVALFLIILQFFRLPARKVKRNDSLVLAPCDGKVVVIEEVFEAEYYQAKRLQVSIFMSPINVHANWYPISGIVKYVKYHTGKYLVAWDPKSSTENERSTIVVEKENKVSVLFRQVAGALAKRIIYYPHEGDMVKQGAEFGFIKFGSRVDIYLPLNAKVKVKIGDKSTGGITEVAEIE
ncbi:MAG: phosphatidylserine decarboxylase family protein [Bacteroidia bacterium]|nr:phosphatidylserine decarboxylase family protein [Bacteroidia bacterium]HQV00298.1 phosphatidylserine decarboxylase family protein [Bacteroidia bacterium]